MEVIMKCHRDYDPTPRRRKREHQHNIKNLLSKECEQPTKLYDIKDLPEKIAENYAAAGIILFHNDECLLGWQHPKNKFKKNNKVKPLELNDTGGKVEKIDATPFDCAYREFQEETGEQFKDSEIKFSSTCLYWGCGRYILYFAQLLTPKIELNPTEEMIKFEWIPLPTVLDEINKSRSTSSLGFRFYSMIKWLFRACSVLDETDFSKNYTYWEKPKKGRKILVNAVSPLDHELLINVYASMKFRSHKVSF